MTPGHGQEVMGTRKNGQIKNSFQEECKVYHSRMGLWESVKECYHFFLPGGCHLVHIRQIHCTQCTGMQISSQNNKAEIINFLNVPLPIENDSSLISPP